MSLFNIIYKFFYFIALYALLYCEILGCNSCKVNNHSNNENSGEKSTSQTILTPKPVPDPLITENKGKIDNKIDNKIDKDKNKDKIIGDIAKNKSEKKIIEFSKIDEYEDILIIRRDDSDEIKNLNSINAKRFYKYLTNKDSNNIEDIKKYLQDEENKKLKILEGGDNASYECIFVPYEYIDKLEIEGYKILTSDCSYKEDYNNNYIDFFYCEFNNNEKKYKYLYFIKK